jgi:hypothetical protein
MRDPSESSAALVLVMSLTFCTAGPHWKRAGVRSLNCQNQVIHAIEPNFASFELNSGAAASIVNVFCLKA